MTAEEAYNTMYNDMPYHIHSMVKVHILKAMKLYANEKLDEAAEMATVKVSKGRNGCKMVVDTDSILKLKDQI